MSDSPQSIHARQTVHALIDKLPDGEIKAAVRFLQFLLNQNEVEEIEDENDVRLAQESLDDPARYSLDSVLKETELQ